VPALLSYWGADERNVFANRAYARWLGMGPADVRGRHLRDVLGQEAYDDYRVPIRGVLSGAPQRFERDVLRLTGTTRAHVICTPDVVDGRVVGFSVLISDVTGHRGPADPGGPPPAPAVRALVVDASPVARAGMRAILASAPDIAVVAEAPTADDALASVGDARPDVVVADARAAGMEALLAARRAPLAGAAFPAVVALVESELDEYLLDPLGLGASTVLAKRAAPGKLAEAVRAVMSGGDMGSRRQQGTVLWGDRRVLRPTPREREVLELAVRGVSNPEIAKRLHLSVDTVKSHLKHVYNKLGVHSRRELIAAIHEAEGS
jgi:PAS domain S-box-containing protein